ncbi:ATP-binding protein [Streptomyces coelicoflavus]|uniref:ATP-binding protein n=1 Tax=Streptomyces coelicoflavus TaxID=285562 RepID=UPI002E2754E7
MRPASTPRLPVTARVFAQRFSSTPRGARLARHLALYRLDAWGVPYGSAVSDTAALLVAELAANAVTHGRVPGRDIEVLLRLDAYTLRIDVSDSRGERRPEVTAAPEDEHGRGLLLVDVLADRWGVFDRVPVGKTVRAELDLPVR